jgi:hypothetical protein
MTTNLFVECTSRALMMDRVRGSEYNNFLVDNICGYIYALEIS